MLVCCGCDLKTWPSHAGLYGLYMKLSKNNFTSPLIARWRLDPRLRGDDVQSIRRRTGNTDVQAICGLTYSQSGVTPAEAGVQGILC